MLGWSILLGGEGLHAAVDPVDVDEAVVGESTDDGLAALVSLGAPVPLSEREPTLRPLQLEVQIRYGLVGTGPTRFVNDIRFAVADGWELRTALAPYPSSLMLRWQLGSQAGDFGAMVLDAGLAHWDAGLRLAPDAGEAAVGLRFHVEGGVAWTRQVVPSLHVFASFRYRQRLSLLADDDQQSIAADVNVTHDLLPWLSVTGGVGYAQSFGPIREIAVNFVEVGRPGVSHFLLRDDVYDDTLDVGASQVSVTVPLALTYGRTQDFDVDLFCTPRLYPKLDILFGAGVRWRYDFQRRL